MTMENSTIKALSDNYEWDELQKAADIVYDIYDNGKNDPRTRTKAYNIWRMIVDAMEIQEHHEMEEIPYIITTNWE